MRWVEDPQGRKEVEKVSKFLKLPIWKPEYLGKFREFWNELWEKIDIFAENSTNILNGKEDKFDKKSGWNLEKTDLTENDSDKVFTSKGALNLFNTLTTNFTNGINAAKEALRLDIVKKLNKGAYSGDAQDLKNEIDTKANKSGDTFTGPVKAQKGIGIKLNEILSFNSDNEGVGWGAWERPADGALVFATRSGIGEYISVFSLNANKNLVNQGEIYALGGQRVYHPLNKPTPAALGLGNVDNTADSNKEVLSATKLKTKRRINGTPFDGLEDIVTTKWGAARNIVIGYKTVSYDGSDGVFFPLPEIGAIDRNGDSISSRLNMSLYGGELTFGVGEGVNFRMFESTSGYFFINSYGDSGNTVKKQAFRLHHETGEIDIDNGKIPLIATLKQQRTDLDFLGANKLDRTNGTYNGFLNFPLEGHGITFNNGYGLGYKIYEHGSSGDLRIEKMSGGVPTGQFVYLNGGSSGRILTTKDCPYPVGGMYFSSSATNPATIWQGTTWKRIIGKVVVGVDEGQGEFNIVNKEGGSKTHTLTVNEIPPHPHKVRRSNNPGSGGLGTVGGIDSPDSWNETTSAGGGQAHNNLQPYVTKYIWERTA